MRYRVAKVLLLLVFLIGLGTASAQTSKAASAKSDDEIKRAIISQSIASYSGNCPCPFNTDRAGRRCGGRSAYSRPGGAAPICFEADVTSKMVADYRRTHKK
jgi:hypothetical protein